MFPNLYIYLSSQLLCIYVKKSLYIFKEFYKINNQTFFYQQYTIYNLMYIEKLL